MITGQTPHNWQFEIYFHIIRLAENLKIPGSTEFGFLDFLQKCVISQQKGKGMDNNLSFIMATKAFPSKSWKVECYYCDKLM